MMSRFVIGGLCAVLLAGLLSGCAERVTGPGMVFQSDLYDFGTVEEGGIINHEFEFTNNGTELLLIQGVASAGGRTYVREFSKEVEPGKSGKISLALKTTGIKGRVSETFLLVTNIPDRPNVPLTIEGTVKAPSTAAVRPRPNR